MSVNKDTFVGPSFSWSNRLKRFIWNMVYSIFFTWSPVFLHPWRIFLLRLFGAKIGHRVHVYPKAKIWAPWNLQLGDECGVANGVNLYSQDKIIVGRRVVISQGSHVVAGSHDYTQPGYPLITAPIHIGNYSWIAADVFIHPGITIGEGCVVGARAVVTRDMPAWMVCAGHPCQPIKERPLFR